MANESSARHAKQASETADREPTKKELERQMQRNRESLAETMGEIRETVEHEYVSAKQTVSGVLDYREQFKNGTSGLEPWRAFRRIRSRLHAWLGAQEHQRRQTIAHARIC